MAFQRIAAIIPKNRALSAFSRLTKDTNVRICLRLLSSETSQNMSSLDNVVSRLKSVAPLSLAGSWDNVGLLVEPSGPKFISKIMLTNDLTAAVMEEAKEKTVDLILSYHPPIFAPVKRLTQASWKERILIECMENRIAVFSPHTSYDAVEDGVNDWLISAFDVDKESVSPVEPSEGFVDNNTHILEAEIEPSNFNEVWKTLTSFLPKNSHLKKNKSAFTTSVIRTGSAEKWRLRLECSHSEMSSMMKGVVTCHAIEKYSVSSLSKFPQNGRGMGRQGKLNNPISLDKAIEYVRSHLDLQHVSVARVEGKEEDLIKTVAVCAGSGSSVLKHAKADLLLTGEMSHHDVLDAVHNDSNVILCHHSNTERGFLKVLQKRLTKVLEKSVNVFVSECDKDPLEIV